MGYQKQNFTSGQTLTAQHLNNIENGIVTNEAAIAGKQPKGNYATEEFVTTKIAEAQVEGAEVDLSSYLTKTEAATTYQPKGDYLTEHQTLKTINGESILGSGNIIISNNTAGTVLSDTCKALLLEILRNAVYTTDQSANIVLLETELNSATDEPDETPVNIKQTGSILAIYSDVTVTQNQNKLLIV